MKISEYKNQISRLTGLSLDDINKYIKQKQKELKGLISDEGALFILSKEFELDIFQNNKKVNNMENDIPTLENSIKYVEKCFADKPLRTAKNGSNFKIMNVPEKFWSMWKEHKDELKAKGYFIYRKKSDEYGIEYSLCWFDNKT